MRKWPLWFFGLGFTVFLIFFFSEVFRGNWILPQTFSIGPLIIHYYGLTMAAAVAAGFYLAIKRAKLYGLDSNEAENLLFWIAIGGFVGARLYHVASSYAYYLAHPADIFKVWNGGLSIYGAVLGGLLALIISQLFDEGNPSLPRVTLGRLDWLAPSLILGQIIGRFGNLFNYEAFGYPTSLPWKMFVPFQFRPVQYQSYNFFHPFFLYEVLGNLITFFFLMKIIKSSKAGLPSEALAKEGALFFSYLLLYNLLRFALEFLRIDSTFIGPLRLNAVMSLLLAIVAACGLMYTKKHAQVP